MLWPVCLLVPDDDVLLAGSGSTLRQRRRCQEDADVHLVDEVGVEHVVVVLLPEMFT